jgi:hypothetical protein
VAALAIGAASAQAGLILSPLGGVTLFKTGDDETKSISLNSTYQFYGQSFSSIDVSTNGNMNFTGYAGFSNVAFPDANVGSMIAPLWDDFVLDNNSRIIEKEGNGFFAVTWNNLSNFNNSGTQDTFQAILFNKDRKFGGIDFQAGDIAFAYGSLGSQLSFDDNATFGVNNTDGSKSSGLPTSGQTLLTSADLPKLDPIKNEFILLHYNGSGYDVSYSHTESAVPEPGTFVVIGLGLAGLVRKSRKRRRPF